MDCYVKNLEETARNAIEKFGREMGNAKRN
jgi:hypothetical protein